MPSDIWGKEVEKTNVRSRRKIFLLSGTPESPGRLASIFAGVIPGPPSHLKFHLKQAQLNSQVSFEPSASQGYLLLSVSPGLPFGSKSCSHGPCRGPLFSHPHFPLRPSTRTPRNILACATVADTLLPIQASGASCVRTAFFLRFSHLA